MERVLQEQISQVGFDKMKNSAHETFANAADQLELLSQVIGRRKRDQPAPYVAMNCQGTPGFQVDKECRVETNCQAGICSA